MATDSKRRDAADVARDRAIATGITHYVLQTSSETWVAGKGARDALWPDLVPLFTFDANGALLDE